MAAPTFKQQKVFAFIRIIGGFVTSLVLGYSTLNNLKPGDVGSTQLLLGGLTLAALAYAGYYTQKLGKLLEQDKAQREQSGA